MPLPELDSECGAAQYLVANMSKACEGWAV